MTNPDADELEEERTLRERVKAKVLALLAWVRAEVGQASEEISPDLSGSLSSVSIPARAIKPLALAGVLLFAAVALPAAPLGNDATTGVETTEEPVVGTTYDAPEDAAEYRRVVESALGTADANAPEPPSEVRASAGTQTMSVATTIVDGEPAIVLEDDRTHSGRWVSVPTSWFKEELGEVPNAAHIDHDSGDTYAAPLRVRGESATFYVKKFSTNTVTFSGEVVLNGDQAGDGTQYQYELNSTSGVDDPSITLTGVETTAPDSVSGTYADGDSDSIDIGGTAPPRDETVTLTGKESTTSRSISRDNVASSQTETVSSNGNDGVSSVSATVDGTTISDTHDHGKWGTSYGLVGTGEDTATLDTSNYNTISEVVIKGQSASGNSYVDVKLDGTVVGSATIDGGDQTYVINADYDVSAASQTDLTLAVSSNNLELNTLDTVQKPDLEVNGDPIGDGSTTSLPSTDGQTVTIEDLNGESISYDLTWQDQYITKDPSVTVGGSTVSHTGTLADGETVTEPVDLSTGSESLDFSTGHTVGVETSWTEVSETRDPAVEVNGETTSYSGTLADGETVSLSANNSSLVEGTNTVNVSTSSPASGPASLVGLQYEHSAESTTSASVSESTWSQSTNVSHTWTDSRSNATATVPMNERVVGVRNVEVRTNGSSWSSVSSSNYDLDGTDLVVELGDVSSGETTEVRATGSKVRVTDGEISVLEPTTGSDQLDTRVEVNSAGPNFTLSVDETIYSERIHYATNATWGETTGESTFSSSGEQSLTLPSATAGGEATVRTWPVEVAPATGSVSVSEVSGDRTEPGFTVRGDGNSEVGYTFVDAADATPYVLYSVTDGIARDQGLASSPITLTDDNSDEELRFVVDEGGASGSGSGTSASAGVAPMAAASGGFTALQALVPDTRLLLLGLIGLAAGIVAVRRSGVVDEGTRGAAAVDAGQEVATTAGGLLERVLENEIVVGALVLGGAAWVLASGVLPADATLIVSLSAVPVALFLVLQQFDRFDFRIWLGSTALVGVFGINALAPELASTIAEETGVLLVGGALLLGWRAVSAFRAEAETPDEVNRVELVTREDDDS